MDVIGENDNNIQKVSSSSSSPLLIPNYSGKPNYNYYMVDFESFKDPITIFSILLNIILIVFITFYHCSYRKNSGYSRKVKMHYDTDDENEKL